MVGARRVEIGGKVCEGRGEEGKDKDEGRRGWFDEHTVR